MITGLHHVAIVVRDLESAAEAYGRLLGVTPQAQDGGGARRAWFWLANMGLELISPDGDGHSGDRVRARLDEAGEGQWLVAFTSDDLAADAALCERRGLAVTDRTERSAMLAPAATAGLQVALMGFPPLAPQTSGGILGLDHVVVQTVNPDRALAIYGAKLGLDLRLDRENAQWGARQIFFKVGGAVVEIGARIGGAVEDKPDRFGGLAWRVDDADAVQARVAAAGFDVSEVRTGRKPGTRVFTVRSGVVAAPALMIQQNSETE